MRKSIFILSVLMLVAASALAAHKKKNVKAAAQVKDIVSISMKKGACYGKCPVYQIDINKSGLVIYTGVRFVQDSGVYQKNVGAAVVKKLFDQFNQYRVDTCMDTYPLRVSDLSGTYFTIQYSNKIKKIGNANFGPAFFGDLISAVNEIAKVDDTWKQVTTNTQK